MDHCYQFLGGPLDGKRMDPHEPHPEVYSYPEDKHDVRPGVIYVYRRMDIPRSRYVFERAFAVKGVVS